MLAEVPLRCKCGGVRGVANVEEKSRIICYCDDCQTYARHLERADVMDAWGGTEIVQVAPSRLRITEGAGSLRCVRLTDKGLWRWYASCCKTPVGNTLPQVPFVGIIASFIDARVARDEVLGPPARVHGEFALGDPPPEVRARPPVVGLLRFATRLLRRFVRGQGRPSPFFVGKTKEPISTPHVLTVEERERAAPRA